MLAIGSDNVVTITSLYDTVSQSFLTAATVTGRLLTSGGSVVTTFTLSLVPGTTADYRGSITAAVSATLTEGASYTVEVTASSGGIILIDRDYHIASYV